MIAWLKRLFKPTPRRREPLPVLKEDGTPEGDDMAMVVKAGI